MSSVIYTSTILTTYTCMVIKDCVLITRKQGNDYGGFRRCVDSKFNLRYSYSLIHSLPVCLPF